jgi:heat shock protein HtpX
MKRIMLFLATNLAIIVVLSISLRILGVERILDEQGVGLDLSSLLVFAAVFGFGGSFLSLADLEVDRQADDGRSRHRAAGERGRAVARRDGAARRRSRPASACPRSAIFDSPDQCLRDRRQPQQGAGGGQHRPAAAMSREEVEAVLGHEVSHVANGDMVTLTLIQGVVNTFVIFLSRVVGHLRRPRGVQDRARPRPGVSRHRDRRRDRVRRARLRHRHVVLAPA